MTKASKPMASAILSAAFWESVMVFVAGGLVLAGCGGPSADRMRSVEESTIARHLREIYGTERHPEGRVNKWTTPIRYVLVGTANEGVKEIVRRSLTVLAEITGIPVVDDGRVIPRETNVLIAFADDFYSLAMSPEVKRVLKRSWETDAQYEEKIRRTIREKAASTRVILYRSPLDAENRGLSPLLVAIVYINGALPREGLESYLLGNVFSLFAHNVARSNVVIPSLTNKGTVFTANNLRHPSAFDRALLEALYSKDVGFRMPTREAIPIMARKIAKALEGQRDAPPRAAGDM